MGITRPAWLIAKQLGLGLDLKGGVQIVLGVQIPEGTPASERTTIVKDVLETIERRVNALGVAEPIIAIQGANRDQILVQLPGVTNFERAKAVIGSIGRLELKIVEQGPATSREALLINGGVSDEMEVVSGLGDRNGETADADVYYLVRRAAAVSGRDLRSARPSLDENNRPAVSCRLTAEAGGNSAQRRKPTSAACSRWFSTGACSRSPGSKTGSPPKDKSWATSPRKRCRACASSCVQARCRRR